MGPSHETPAQKREQSVYPQNRDTSVGLEPKKLFPVRIQFHSIPHNNPGCPADVSSTAYTHTSCPADDSSSTDHSIQQSRLSGRQLQLHSTPAVQRISPTPQHTATPVSQTTSAPRNTATPAVQQLQLHSIQLQPLSRRLQLHSIQLHQLSRGRLQLRSIQQLQLSSR